MTTIHPHSPRQVVLAHEAYNKILRKIIATRLFPTLPLGFLTAYYVILNAHYSKEVYPHFLFVALSALGIALVYTALWHIHHLAKVKVAIGKVQTNSPLAVAEICDVREDINRFTIRCFLTEVLTTPVAILVPTSIYLKMVQGIAWSNTLHIFIGGMLGIFTAALFNYCLFERAIIPLQRFFYENFEKIPSQPTLRLSIRTKLLIPFTSIVFITIALIGVAAYENILTIPGTGAAAVATNYGLHVLILTVSILIISVSLSVLLARSIAQPIKDMKGVMDEIGATSPAPASLSKRTFAIQNDEMGFLGNAFNNMLAQLQELNINLERKVAERTDDLRIANEKLKVLDRSKSSFLATISHELKTPMTLIATPLEQALSRSAGDKIELGATEAESVRRNVHRLSDLVGDLVELARGEVGKSEVVPSEIRDVKKHFTDLFEGMKPLFEEKGIGAEFVVEGKPASHFFDIKKIDKVFYNLLGNALKFTPKGGGVEVHLKDVIGGQKEPALELAVADNGIGIPSDKLSKIFERFVQVEEGATRSYEGMGIGLSLVKDFVEQHGGTVTVESEVGRGSQFTVSLPRGREHFKAVMVETKGEPVRVIPPFELPHAIIPATPDSQKRSPGERTILVVEDNPDLRESIARILEEEHYGVVSAANGQEGLEKARETRPTLIITDIMMPVMDGYQMMREIRKEKIFKDLPIIVLTAKSGEEGLAEGFEAGADDYLTKPFSSLELKLRVKNHLEKQEWKGELVRQQNLASVGTLSAGISHNMNTYAATVDAGLSLAKTTLKEQELPNAAKTEILESLVGAKGGLQSIRNMIGALEIYSQKNVEGFKEDNLAQTTMAVIDLAKTKVPPNVVIEFDSPRSVPCYYDAHLLNPAIMNLVANAIDASREQTRGRILVSLSDDSDDTILLTVRDNGHGIPPDIRHRIWDPFFTTKEIGNGTGLGLWMVRRAIEMDHRGKVWFETGREGTVFYVSLPKKRGRSYERVTTKENSLHRGRPEVWSALS